MICAKDIMTTTVITATPDTEIKTAAKLLLENNINGLPIVDRDNKLVGILCKNDLIEQQKNIPVPSFFSILDGFVPLSSSKHLEKELHKIAAVTVADAMTTPPITVTPDTTIHEVASLMADKKFHTLPVVDKDRLIGVIGKEDVLRTLIS